MNSTECPFLFALSYLVAKIVQIEQKTKFYLSFFEMPPIFDLILRSEINKTPQTTKLFPRIICFFAHLVVSLQRNKGKDYGNNSITSTR